MKRTKGGSVQAHYLLKPQQHQAVKATAAAHGMSASELLGWLIDDWLAQSNKEMEDAR
jgi:hypothetical protein